MHTHTRALKGLAAQLAPVSVPVAGWANGELQCYKDSAENYGIADVDGCTNGGCLYITAVQLARPTACPNQWVSGAADAGMPTSSVREAHDT